MGSMTAPERAILTRLFLQWAKSLNSQRAPIILGPEAIQSIIVAAEMLEVYILQATERSRSAAKEAPNIEGAVRFALAARSAPSSLLLTGDGLADALAAADIIERYVGQVAQRRTAAKDKANPGVAKANRKRRKKASEIKPESLKARAWRAKKKAERENNSGE